MSDSQRQHTEDVRSGEQVEPAGNEWQGLEAALPSADLPSAQGADYERGAG